MFLDRGLPMALSQSYAKNMGMYGQRVGALSVVCDNAKEAAAVESQLKAVARAGYSNPPLHGAYLVHEILSNPELKKQWCALVRKEQSQKALNIGAVICIIQHVWKVFLLGPQVCLEIDLHISYSLLLRYS